MKTWISNKIEKDAGSFEKLPEEMNEILKLAVIETGNIELFEYSLLQNADNVYELQRYAINKEINNLMSFLSKGLMKNAMVYKLTKAF